MKITKGILILLDLKKSFFNLLNYDALIIQINLSNEINNFTVKSLRSHSEIHLIVFINLLFN